MTRYRTAAWPIAVAATLTLAAGCSTGGPTDKDTPLQTQTVAQVTAQAEADVKVVTDAAGTPLINKGVTTPPCTGKNGEFADDGRWYLSLAANLAVTPADRISTLQKIKAEWEKNGREITEDKTSADDARNALSSKDPTTGHSMTLTTTPDENYLALILVSDCYMPASGEDPANG